MPDTDLPDANEMPSVHTDTRAISGVGYLLLLGLFGAIGVWAYFVNLSGAIIAQGIVSVQGKPKTIQHLDGGIVVEINVQDGDAVKRGDVLVRLDEKLLNSNLAVFGNNLKELNARKARLIAERDDKANITWRDAYLGNLEIEPDHGIRSGQQKLFIARRDSRSGQILQLKERISQARNQITGIEGLATSVDTQLTMVNNELDIISGLKKKGFATNLQVIELKRQRESLNGQSSNYISQKAQQNNQISEINIQILQVERQFRQGALEELRTVEQQINENLQQHYTTREKLRRINVRAPVDGIIHELGVFTIGGVVGPGNAIMQIIPQGNKFEIEAQVQPQYIDQMYPGQQANLLFSAFNQKTTPQIIGQIANISPNIIVDPVNGSAYYKVRLQIAENELTRLKDKPLVAGMPVEVFIKTQERTALNYIIKPLTDQIRRAFKEQ